MSVEEEEEVTMTEAVHAIYHTTRASMEVEVGRSRVDAGSISEIRC